MAEQRELSDTEAVLVLYFREWLHGPANAPITPEAAAGDCIRLWGSAREALVARGRLSDGWSRKVNALLMEALRDAPE